MEDLSRIEGAVDPVLMANTTVVVVGIGGAVGLSEDLVRSNIGSIIAIDFDVVDKSNLTTQGFNETDVGTPKIEALGKTLKSINPNINYKAVNADFLELSEEEVGELVEGADILLFMTDNFQAQARGNRIALKYQKPAIFAIAYSPHASEITFVIPGITPGCHRCAVSPRYKAYEEGYQNVVKQTRSTVFQTHYLNSCLGFLVLAILHRNTTGFEFSNWFGDYWDRNLVQLRMHPNYGTSENSLFTRVFQKTPYVFTFDAIWQKIEAECPPKYEPCPDCGGIGDLTKVKGITNTKLTSI